MNNQQPIYTEQIRCQDCYKCVRNCPVKAITVDAGVGCASGLINEWMQERNLRAPGGSCCS